MATTQGQEPGNLGVIRLEPTGIKLGATGDGTFDRRIQICSTFVTQNTTPYKHALHYLYRPLLALPNVLVPLGTRWELYQPVFWRWYKCSCGKIEYVSRIRCT